MLFATNTDIDTVAAELNQEHDVALADAVPVAVTVESADSTPSPPSPNVLSYSFEVGVDGSEGISDDPEVLTAVADVLSTPATKSFTKKAFEAVHDVQDSCADDFALLCKENPKLGFTFSDVRALFDELMSSNEDVSATSTNPVATWYRRHLTEESHAKHAGSAGMKFLQAMKDAVEPRHILHKLQGLFDRHRDQRRMDATHGRPVHHEHTGHRDHDDKHRDGPHRIGGDPATWTPHPFVDPAKWIPRHPHVDKPVPPAAPATPVSPAPAPATPPAAAATKRHLFGEPEPWPEFHMDDMPKMQPAHFGTGAMPMGPMFGRAHATGPTDIEVKRGDDDDSDSDDDDDDHPHHGMRVHFTPPHRPLVSGRGPHDRVNSYSGALGFGAKGDSCIMLNYAKLSTECKSSLKAIGQVRAEYVQSAGDPWHGHHHHHPLLFFGMLGVFGYFFYRRHVKMKSIRQILNVIDANPSLKAQVEAAAGVEIPKHNESCASLRNAVKCMFKSFGRAAIFVAAFFFIAITTLTLAGIVVSAIMHHRNRACEEYNHSLPDTADAYAYHQCEGPGAGLILFVVFTIAAIETTVLVYFAKGIQSACGCADPSAGDADAPTVATGANWYPGQIYAALPAESSHGAAGAELRTFTANTGTSPVTAIATNNQPAQMREVRPYSQVTML
jgi:hypothetical protein